MYSHNCCQAVTVQAAVHFKRPDGQAAPICPKIPKFQTVRHYQLINFLKNKQGHLISEIQLPSQKNVGHLLEFVGIIGVQFKRHVSFRRTNAEQGAESVRIWKNQNQTVSELESVRIGMCWNTQVSQSQSDLIGKCQNMNVSEYTPRLHVQILTSPAAAVHFKRTDAYKGVLQSVRKFQNSNQSDTN